MSNGRFQPVFGAGELESAFSKAEFGRSLLGNFQERQEKGLGVAIRITIICCLHSLRDDDTLADDLKLLRDAIAKNLGFDEADWHLSWDCQQVQSDVTEGIRVKLEYTVIRVKPSKRSNQMA